MDDTDRPLALALAELARTMPDDPRRLTKVRERARRARRRRTVAQGTVVTATVGGLALGLVASGPGSGGGSGSPVTGVPAAAPAQPDTTAPTEPPPVDPAALPTCTDVAAQQAAKAAAVVTMDEADAKKAAQAAADGQAPTEDDGADPAEGRGEPVAPPFDPAQLGQRGPFTGNALVSGSGDGPTLTLSVKGVALTLVVDEATRFVVDAADAARPPLADGTEVGFQASRTAAGDLHLDVLEVGPPKTPAESPADDSAVTGGGMVQGAVTTPPVAGTAVVVGVDDGPLTGRTVTFVVGDGTQWLAGKEPCRPTDLADGSKFGFTATAADDGTYTLVTVELPGG